MPTTPRRWSVRLEGQRAGAEAAAASAAQDLAQAHRLITEARRVLYDQALVNRLLLEAMNLISQARTDQERIQRLMLEAQIGRE